MSMKHEHAAPTGVDFGSRDDRSQRLIGTPESIPALTVGLSLLSSVLEYFDYIIYIYFVVVLSRLFFPSTIPPWLSQLQTLSIFAAGYVARPFGGIVFSHFGDRFGRKTTFMFTVSLMAFSSVGITILPTYASIGIAAPLMLLILRVMQGIAIGGEVPGSWTFVAEHVPRKRLGLAAGLMMSGIVGGIFLGSLAALVVNSRFSPADVLAYAWRLPFLAGGLAGLVSVYLRRYLIETPIFRELQQNRALVAKLPIRVVMAGHLRGVAMSIAAGSFLATTNVILLVMCPTLFQTIYHIAPEPIARAAVISSICALLGSMTGGILIDKIGCAWFVIVSSICFALSIICLFSALGSHPSWLVPLYSTACFFIAAYVGVPYIMIASFPPAVRYTGIALSYNMALAVFGGLTPLVVTWGFKFDPMAHQHVATIACGIYLVVGWILLRSGPSDAKPAATRP
jgi:predicted MFS family arabinose efflux permease